jgi:hypothetical protein
MEAPLKKVILPNGAVDWEAFQELVTEKDFLVYDPPQMLGSSVVTHVTPQAHCTSWL